MLFAYAARRNPLCHVGLVQYLNPTLQFLSRWRSSGSLHRWHAVAFGLIWSGLALYSWGSWRRGYQASRAARLA